MYSNKVNNKHLKHLPFTKNRTTIRRNVTYSKFKEKIILNQWIVIFKNNKSHFFIKFLQVKLFISQQAMQ